MVTRTGSDLRPISGGPFVQETHSPTLPGPTGGPEAVPQALEVRGPEELGSHQNQYVINQYVIHLFTDLISIHNSKWSDQNNIIRLDFPDFDT